MIVIVIVRNCFDWNCNQISTLSKLLHKVKLRLLHHWSVQATRGESSYNSEHVSWILFDCYFKLYVITYNVVMMRWWSSSSTFIIIIVISSILTNYIYHAVISCYHHSISIRNISDHELWRWRDCWGIITDCRWQQ